MCNVNVTTFLWTYCSMNENWQEIFGGKNVKQHCHMYDVKLTIFVQKGFSSEA